MVIRCDLTVLGVVNQIFGNRTQLNSITRLSSIGLGNRTYRNRTDPKILPLECNLTFSNRALQQSKIIKLNRM